MITLHLLLLVVVSLLASQPEKIHEQQIRSIRQVREGVHARR